MLNGRESACLIEPLVAILHHGDWSIVHIEQDGIIMCCWSSGDDMEDVFDEHFDTFIIERKAIDGMKVLAIPRDDFWQELRDADLGIRRDEGEHLA